MNNESFWECWKKRYKSKPELAIQNGDIWVTRFKSLYTPTTINNKNNNNGNEQNTISENLNTFEPAIKDSQTPLDSPVTELELSHALATLKSKKASGPDAILTKMIKQKQLRNLETTPVYRAIFTTTGLQNTLCAHITPVINLNQVQN